jgi:hypothetical protein
MRSSHALRVLTAGAVMLVPFALLASPPPVPRNATIEAIRTEVPRSTGRSTAAAATHTDPAPGPTTAQEPARFAFFYIWYSRSSWRRAKSDLPLLGRYDSGDVRVMRQQIRWAKASGIDGFIVSWKHTPVLDERLAKLVDVADEEHFSLAIIYQGLDFDRNPLPVAQIGAGLTWFDRHLASRIPFRRFGKPLVIWSGTWKFGHDEIASVTTKLRGDLRILGSAKNAKDYLRIADVVDGDAYYWSSVNPTTNSDFATKLRDMSDSVHAHDGTWVAPAAVGFDARMLGGKTVVGRDAGATFRAELAAAKASSPDVIGLISWNEFSENSHIEPSERYGTCALGYVAISAGLPSPEPNGCSNDQAAGRVGPIDPIAGKPKSTTRGYDAVDSSAAGSGPAYGPYVVGGFGLFLVVALVITVRRRQQLRYGLDQPHAPHAPPMP